MSYKDKPTAALLGEMWWEARRRDKDLIQQDIEVENIILDKTPQVRPRHAAANARFEEYHSRELFTYTKYVEGVFKDPPRFEVHEVGTSARAARRANEVERWLNNLVPEVMRQQRENVRRQVLNDVIWYARGAFKVHAAKHYWDDDPMKPKPPTKGSRGYNDKMIGWEKDFEEYRHSARIPIAIRHVHPSYFHWWRDDLGMAEAIEVQLRQVRDILASYDFDRRPAILKEMNQADYVWWFEHQNRCWVTYGVFPGSFKREPLKREKAPDAAQMVILDQWEHGYGDCSYVFIPGDETSQVDPRDRYVPLIWGVLPTLLKRDQTVAQVASYVRQVSWPYWTLELSEDSMAGIMRDEKTGRPIPWEMEPMMVNPVLPGERPGSFSPPPLPPDTYQLINFLQKEIDLHLMLPLLEGNVADYSAGYPLAIRSQATRTRYNAIAENWRMAHVELGKLLLRCVEALGHPVSVFLASDNATRDGVGEYLDMTPEMAKRPYHIDARMELTMKSEENLKLRMALEATGPRTEPLLSDFQALEEILGVEDPEQAIRLRERQKARQLAFEGVALRLKEILTQKMQEEAALRSGPMEGGIGATPGQVMGNAVAPGFGMPTEGAGPGGPRMNMPRGGLIPGQTGGVATNGDRQPGGY